MSGMRQCDIDFMERLKENGNPLGWTPHGRDEDGHAILRTTLPGSINPQTGKRATRICHLKITPTGIIHAREQVIGGPRRLD